MPYLATIKYSYTLVFLGFLFVTLPLICTAQTYEYTPLVNLPGLNQKNNTTLPQYLNGIYLVIISIGAFYGVIKISIAGVKYSMSEVVTTKGDAIKDIQGVLLGLLILLMPYVVLKTINPDLLSLDVLKGMPKIDTSGVSGEFKDYGSLTTQESADKRLDCFRKGELYNNDLESCQALTISNQQELQRKKESLCMAGGGLYDPETRSCPSAIVSGISQTIPTERYRKDAANLNSVFNLTCSGGSVNGSLRVFSSEDGYTTLMCTGTKPSS